MIDGLFNLDVEKAKNSVLMHYSTKSFSWVESKISQVYSDCITRIIGIHEALMQIAWYLVSLVLVIAKSS